MSSAIESWEELANAQISDLATASSRFFDVLLGAGSQKTSNERMRTALRPTTRGLDRLFYNVAPDDEQQILALNKGMPQGSVIVVSPDRKRPLSFFADVVDFLDDRSHGEVGAISVAGLGSSSVGAVGLARDVATALDLPVAAVVCGYGINDLVTEAIGGAFTLRGINQLEFLFEQMQHSLGGVASFPGLLPLIEDYDSSGAGPDLAAAKALLRSSRLPELRWVVGHSKGNLVISGAIAELVFEDPDYVLEDANVVLFSALTALPPQARHQYQFIGSLDLFGKLNSRLNIGHQEVCGAMHHLNTKLPYALNAQEQLSSIRQG